MRQTFLVLLRINAVILVFVGTGHTNVSESSQLHVNTKEYDPFYARLSLVLFGDVVDTWDLDESLLAEYQEKAGKCCRTTSSLSSLPGILSNFHTTFFLTCLLYKLYSCYRVYSPFWKASVYFGKYH